MTTLNKLILGDNLEVMKQIEDMSVDLIYLDPPFFSNRNYEAIWGDDGEVRSFQDKWEGGMEHYIAWLYERVEQMHRILKNTGSIYLHCDWHADAYIRVNILDKLFGTENFRNAIAWCYNVGGKSKKQYARKKDTIFWYSKTNVWIFNANKIGIKRDTGTKSTGGRMGTDENGRPYQDKIVKKTGKIYRYYLDENKIPEDWWVDINSIQSGAIERIGYPTQKPEALLERIIKASSNKDDIVLDPFVGGGTTISVADRLERKWIGIDESAAAIKVSGQRLENQRELMRLK
jgi:DNA modification methylase